MDCLREISPEMGRQGLVFCFLLVSLSGFSSQSPPACDEVLKVFELKQIGPPLSLPDTSRRAGTDLQVCVSRNLTCCTKHMEERYQADAQRDFQDLLRMASSSLKGLISRNVAAFQETMESLARQGESQTNAIFLATYRNMAPEAVGPIQELFTDVGLFLLGSELAVDGLVRRFFDSLFPLVYDHLIDPGPGAISLGDAECVRAFQRRLAPFGGFPGQLAEQMGRGLVPGRLFLQALNLGVEVINMTEHLRWSRECRHALLKMLYCPHCQGLTGTKPCTGYCLNVMRGCLASLAEVDAHWREFVLSLEGLSDRMQESADLEHTLLGVPSLLSEAVALAQRNAPRLLTQVHRACGQPNRKAAQSVGVGPDGNRDAIPLRASGRAKHDTMSSKRRQFLARLRVHRTFYASLADQLCVSNMALEDGLSCWNGTDVVKSYTRQVVGSGIKAQAVNPEVKVKAVDPAVLQIIDKLKHVTQLLRGKQIPKNGMLDLLETGSGGSEWHFSGECDDEDGCDGSGHGEGKRSRTSSEPGTPDKAKDYGRLGPPVETAETAQGSGVGGVAPVALLILCVMTALVPLWC